MESVDRFKAAMDSDRGALGPFMICTDPAMVEAAGHAGYDFVLLDMEHGTTTFQELPNLIRAFPTTAEGISRKSTFSPKIRTLCAAVQERNALLASI